MNIIALLALTSLPAFAAPTIYIDIAACETKGRPESSFKLMVDGMTADKPESSPGLLIFNEIPSPDSTSETTTMAISATIEKNKDGSYSFENLLTSFPGEGKILVKPGQVTESTVGNFTFVCRGKKLK